MASGFVIALLSAIQAAASVLVTIGIGVASAQFDLLTPESAKDISHICVNIFLPFATVTCNNTTSLPLFLIQSLDSTGVLDSISSGNKNIADKLRSYFLVFAVANNIFTFGAGEPAMKGFSNETFFSTLRKLREKIVGKTPNDEEAQGSDGDDEDDDDEQDGQRPQGSGQDGETTPLLPQNFIRWEQRTKSPGAIIGLVPALHKLFFDPMQEGGYFKGWLTSSLKNVGELFVLMPLLSIPIIWVLAKKTDVLPSDPAVWFAMMLMPVGPPAMKLIALADVNGINGRTRMSIAKLLTFAYAVTPLVALTVVAALRATESIKG
ncbi:unnamed protein product [Parascedosporium putredinis]|uniref:Auxin efflux carrier n=1 Tax=Parascedosporium putredinis TaxID=1442378 RepID=A0A9P1M976_9PEZI|nr:unnamed protein product [Parascedosporium putredinis]CAI7994124.1 unnamed protein product [Parascedosporium putredinis]